MSSQVKNSSCSAQIITQLQDQNIKFSQNDNAIIVREQNNIKVQLIVSDCNLDMNLLFKEIQSLDITELKLLNIQTSKQLIEMNSIDSIDIKSLEISNDNISNAQLFGISKSQNVKIDIFKCYKTQFNQIQADNVIDIGYFIVDQSVNETIESNNLISINNITINQSQYQIISNITSITQIKALQSNIFIQGKLKLSIDLCYYCDLNQFQSQQINIDKYYYTQAVNLEATLDNQVLIINNFNINYEILERDFKFSIEGYQNVNINNIEVKQEYVLFQFYKIKNLHLNNMILNPQIKQIKNDGNNNGLFSITSCGQVIIENVQYMNSINQNCSSIGFQLQDSISLQFIKFNISNVRMCKYLFQIDKVDNILFQDFELNTVMFTSDALILLGLSKNIIFNNMKITNQIKDAKDYPHGIKIDNDFIKKNLDSVIQVHSLIQYFIRDTSNQHTQATNITLSGINADYGGYNTRFFDLLMSDFLQQVNVNIIDSYFSNMYNDLNGGCIRTQFYDSLNKEYQLSIERSKFFNCSSNVYGGAIYTNGNIFLKDIVIEKSKGRFGGAVVIFRSYFLLQFENVQFIDNYSKYYDNDVFIFWQRFQINQVIEFSEYYKNEYIIQKYINKTEGDIFNLFPGIVYIVPITILAEKYPLRHDDDKYIENTLDDPLFYNLYSYINSDDTELYHDLLDYDLNKYYSKPYLIIKINQNNSNSDFIFNFGYFVFLHYNTSNCVGGQQVIQNQFQMNYKYSCQYCPYMTASYQNNSNFCFSCDSLYFNYCYSNVTSLSKGYFRQNHNLDRSQIYTCQFNQKSCIGGEGYGNDLCNEGHVGIECKSCDVFGKYWNQTYGNSGYYQCTKCRDIQYNILFICILFIIFIGVTFLVINSNTKNIERQVIQTYLSKMNIIYIGSSFRNLGLASIYIKVFSFYSSMLFFIQQQISLNIKNTLLDFSIQFQNPLIQGFVSLDCALAEIFDSQSNYSQIKLLSFIMMPIIVIPIIILLQLIKLKFNYFRLNVFIYSIFLAFIYLTFIVFYNQILSVVLDALFCRTFQNNESYSLLDLTVSCNNIESNYFIAIPILLGYCILIPLFLLIAIVYNRSKLQKIKTMFQLGFLYKEYKEKYFYWEMIRFLVRVSQIIVSKLFIYNLVFMNSVNIIILILYLTALLLLKPFQRPNINKFELISIVINIQNFLSLIIYQNSQEYNQTNPQKQPAEYFLILSSYCSMIYLLALLIIITYSFLDLIIIKLLRRGLFQRIFQCSFCLNKEENTKRAIKNLQLMRKVSKRVIEKNRDHYVEFQTFIQHQQQNLTDTNIYHENINLEQYNGENCDSSIQNNESCVVQNIKLLKNENQSINQQNDQIRRNEQQ